MTTITEAVLIHDVCGCRMDYPPDLAQTIITDMLHGMYEKIRCDRCEEYLWVAEFHWEAEQQ